MNRILILIFLIFCIGIHACKKHAETETGSHRLVLTADPYLPLMQQQVEQYMSLYPEVKIEVRGASTRESVVHLLNDSVRSIVIDRPLNEEERQVAQQASIRIIENKIAMDGIALIVHKQNPIPNITKESVRRIITREAKDWSEIAEGRGSGAIDLVLTGRNSGMYELLRQGFFSISKPLEPTAVVNNQHEAIRYVSLHPYSIGCIAASLVSGKTAGIKVLPVVSTSPEDEKKEYLPGQQEIYSSLYPFHYSLYLYNTEAKAAVGVGFSAFILSTVGQKIIQKAGLTPVSIPYRTIQLNAE